MIVRSCILAVAHPKRLLHVVTGSKRENFGQASPYLSRITEHGAKCWHMSSHSLYVPSTEN